MERDASVPPCLLPPPTVAVAAGAAALTAARLGASPEAIALAASEAVHHCGGWAAPTTGIGPPVSDVHTDRLQGWFPQEDTGCSHLEALVSNGASTVARDAIFDDGYSSTGTTIGKSLLGTGVMSATSNFLGQGLHDRRSVLDVDASGFVRRSGGTFRGTLSSSR